MLQKASVVFTVVVTGSFVFYVVAFCYFSTLRSKCRLNAYTRLKQKQDGVETMNFVLLEVSPA